MAWSIYFWTMVVIYVVFHATLAIIVSLFDSSGRINGAVCRSWARNVLRTARVKVHIDGTDIADCPGPRIYMSNHQSYFDVISLMAHLPDNARFVAKKSLEYIPFFGQGMRAVGTVIIDRRKPELARRTLSEIAESNMGKGVGVIIFPEGTRSRDGKLGLFKKGGFVLAIQTGATIVPVGISGSRHIMPADGYRVKPGEIFISIGDPISTDGFSIEDKDALIEKTQKAIEDLMEKSSKKELSKVSDNKQTSAEAENTVPAEGSTASPPV